MSADRPERRSRAPRRARPSRGRRRRLARRLVDPVLRRYDRPTLVAAASSAVTAVATAAVALGHGGDATAVGQRAAAAWSLVFTAVTAWALLRRRSATAERGAFFALLIGVTGTSGALAATVDLLWADVASLVAIPIGAVLFLRPRGVVTVALACATTQVALICSTGSSTGVVLQTSGMVVLITLVPVVLVLVLLRQLRAAHAETARAAVTDQLTGLLNRRGLTDGLAALLADATAAGEPVTIVVADLDHFKDVNDTWGHETGDAVLVAVAATLRTTARAGDLLVRMGGEELVWVAHFPSAVDVARAAERLRSAVPAGLGPHLPRVTASVGVATATGPGLGGLADAAAAPGRSAAVDALLQLLSRADAALYDAKRNGRDRVVVADGPGPRVVPA